MSESRHISDKYFSAEPKSSPQVPDSTTEVNFASDEPRKTVSFKCNKNLWKSFVCQTKLNGLSVCHVLESMIYGWLTAQVYFSRTLKPLHIENLNVERVVARPRRKFVETEVWHPEPKPCWCGGAPFAEVLYPGGSQFLCRHHFGEEKSRLKAHCFGWRILIER